MEIIGFDANHQIEVRWDNPLATFSVIILDRQIEAAIERGESDEETTDPIVLWLGGTLGEIPTLQQLKTALAAYAVLSEAAG